MNELPAEMRTAPRQGDCVEQGRGDPVTPAEKWKLIEPFALKLAELDRQITEVVESTPYYQSRHEELFNEQRRWHRDVLRLMPCVATGDAEGISRFEPPVAENGERG